jgi:hypothetical protein
MVGGERVEEVFGERVGERVAGDVGYKTIRYEDFESQVFVHLAVKRHLLPSKKSQSEIKYLTCISISYRDEVLIHRMERVLYDCVFCYSNLIVNLNAP